MNREQLRKSLFNIMEKDPASARHYGRLIGISPMTLKSFLFEETRLNMRTFILIKKFVEKEEKKS